MNILQKLSSEIDRPHVKNAEGIYLQVSGNRKLLDTTAGGSSWAVLGYSHREVLDAMRQQMDKFCHIDYRQWNDPNTEVLGELLLQKAPTGLSKVYLAGNSGSEAVEAAMKMSFQAHLDSGEKSKTWFISRVQSYHGMTTDALAVSEKPNMAFFEPMLPTRRAKISQHHPLYFKRDDETLDQYAQRSAQELEDKILEIGPENVCAFIGEPILGGLIGDVPPAPNYWKYVQTVCKKYNVHLILDEIYCGLGRSGKVYCCDWDGVSPDFVCVGKALAAGYSPLSAVITTDDIEQKIVNGRGQFQHSHTHQGHSLGVSAAIQVQRVVQAPQMLEHIYQQGVLTRNTLKEELGNHPFFREVRGRGLSNSIEYDCRDKHQFSLELSKIMQEKHDIIISGKWHRVSFTPPYLIQRMEMERVLDCFISSFKQLAANW